MDGLVVLADVKASRRVADRDELATALSQTLDQVNSEHADELLAPFEVQRGVDEFGGLLEGGADLGDLILSLWEGLHPVAVRLAVVRGGIDILRPDDEPTVRESDGPAFHAATDLLDEVERGKRFLGLSLGGASHGQRQVEHVGNLLYMHMLGWTPRQLEILLSYKEHGSQKAAAERLAVTQPTISEALSSIHGSYMLESMQTFREELRLIVAGENR